MRNFSIKRFTASLLLIVMLVAAVPATLFDFAIKASAAESDTIYVLAGGDFQEAGDHANSAANVTNILAQVSQKYETMDGFLFIGDYDCETHNSATETANGITALMGAVQSKYSNLNDANSVLVQGNHDYMDSRIDATGGHEFEGYSAYVLNEDDYPNGGGSQSGIQTLANNLKTWLNNKIGEGYSAPIFIVSHLPLAYTPRTVTQGDAKYAKYIFDVLNDAGKNGLNIIFLHGHDHAYGPDNYMGGEAIYLPVGDKICIAEAGSTSAWTEETLNFTYMNAGYTGYYSDAYTYVTTAGTDKLTMTVFAITDNQVTVERYSEDGLYNLKSAGYNGSYSNTSVDNVSLGLPMYSNVYASPQTITLVENNAADMGTIGNWVGISASTPADDVTTSNKGWVELIAPVPETPAVPGTPESTKYVYTLDTDGTVTDKADAEQGYLIVGSGNASAMTDSLGATGVTITDNAITHDAQPDYEWWITADGKITDGTNYLKFTGTYQNYQASGSVSVTTNASEATSWDISHSSNGAYNISYTYSYGSWVTRKTTYYLRYNSNAFSVTSSSNTVRLFSGAEVYTPATEGTPAVPGTNGTYGKIVGDLTYNATVGMSADEAMALVKAGIDGYYYDAMSTPGTNVTGTKVDDSVLTWEWVDTFDGNTAGDYEVAIKYGDFLLGTAEVVVPATTTYYMAEGNGLYLVDMNTTEANAMAAVKAGVTVYSATDASGSNKTAISDDDVTWEWVDTYNGADSGPYTVEILKDGTSLGTVEVKVNIRYETGIEDGWTYIGESEATGGTYTYTLDTDGIDAGSSNKYIIVAENQALALHTSGSSASTAVSVNISSDGKTLTTSTRDYEYYWNSTYGFTRGSYGLHQSGYYIYLGEKSASYMDGVINNGDGTYCLYDNEGTRRTLYYNGSRFTVSEEDNYTDVSVRLYKYTGMTGGTPAGSIYALIEGNTVYTVAQGSSATKALAAVKAGITGYTATDANGTGKTEIADSDLTWKWKNTFNGNSTGSYWVEISYQGKVLGTVEVQVVPAVVDDYPDYPNEGAVKVNKTAIYTDEDFRKTGVAQVELSVSGVPSKKGADVIVMLDTSSSMTSWCICGTQNCTSTGSSHQRRSAVLEESLKDLIAQFKTPGDDGQLLDIRVALADFNGFYGDNQNSSGTPYDRDAADMMSDDISYNASSEAQVYTGDGTLGAGAFIPAEDLAATYTLNYTSGTNYDYAFDAVYQLGTAIKDANGNEKRDLYVVFMSDGAAMQWNYYHSQGNSDIWGEWITGTWSKDELDLNCTEHSYYYNLDDTNGDGLLNEHRMANAIKGDPTLQYEVIRKTDTLGTPTGTTNMYNVPGLGATMFSIAFDPRADGNVEAHYMTTSIATLASEETDTTKYYYEVSSADELASAFTSIGSAIAYAANNARFVDQMGDAFDLQLSSSVTRTVDGTPVSLKFTPTITVKTYDIWTRQDYLTEQCTIDQIGVRKGTSTVLENVTFNADGTEAYSDQINNSGTNILADGTQAGYYKNVIYAKTFVYNNNKDGTYAYLDTDGDGVEDYALAPETFYWKVGTVQSQELAISYFVYLTDTMDGERASGSYATNNFAILYYDNYLGNECKIHTVSPMLAWKEANVSYAFYLVDQNGAVIVNRATGETGTFANKVAVTRPIVYDTCKLNTETKLAAIEIAKTEGILPEGYKIFDEAASYSVVVLSDQTDKVIGWEINKAAVATTYVTGYSTTDPYSNAQSMHETGHDYTHTTVWFAVVWTPSTIPDQVVIDYGLPVDINVLENDLFGAGAKLYGIADDADKPTMAEGTNYITSHIASFVSSLDLKALSYGSALINGDKVRYIPENMEMDGYEKFAYEVQYVINNETQYYYGDVTVIPATTIYYEEEFVTFENGYEVNVSASGTPNPSTTVIADGSKYGAWSVVGTEVKDATQSEDRPGKDSLGTIDSDNIYGYDGINNNLTEYSLGAAMQATVHKVVNEDGSYITTGYNGYTPKATFTFTGTGFDIISLTDSDSGMIMVSVVDADGENVYSQMITNYYGMSYEILKNEDGSNKVDENGDPIYGFVSAEKVDGQDTIWQVPVIKKAGLKYGTYTVTIQIGYMNFFDQDNGGTGNGEYYFVLDAIRIYDPANDGTTDSDSVIENAYAADNESNPHYLMIKDAILAAADADTLFSDGTEGSGVVFIDGIPATNKVNDYKNPGPNNEAYLAPGQSISFKLKSNATPLGVHIGYKLAYGSSVDVQFTYTSSSGKSDSKGRTLISATDMYYPITDYLGLVRENQESTTGVAWESGTITITNVSTGDAVVSLTNIKATFKYATTISGDKITPAANASASAGVYSLMSARMMNLETATEEEPVSISFLVDAEVIEDACAVMTALYAPEPEIFTPEVLEHTVISGWFGINTVRVITSKDVASVTVNGVEASKLNDSKIVKTMLKLLDKLNGSKNVAGDYYIWTVTAKRADSYEIVAYNAEGIPSDPALAESAINVGNNGVANSINREEIEKILNAIAEKHFDPEQFKTEFNKRFDGKTEIVVETSDDVSYVIIGGKIVKRYITETVIDTETGETTTKRVWIADAEEDEEVEVNVYDEKGVGSESKKMGRKGNKENNKNEEAAKEDAKETPAATKKPNKNAPKATTDVAPKTNNKKNNGKSVIAKFFNM